MQSRPIPGSLAPIFALFAAALLFGALEARADLAYSVDVASPSFPAVSNSDVLSRPFYGVPPPAVVFPAAALGLAGAPADEIDAFTYGVVVGLPLFFSVDAAILIPGPAPAIPAACLPSSPSLPRPR